MKRNPSKFINIIINIKFKHNCNKKKLKDIVNLNKTKKPNNSILEMLSQITTRI